MYNVLLGGDNIKKIALVLFALAIAICFTGAVSATDSVTDKNCNTNYQLNNYDNWNGEEKNTYDQRYDNLNYEKDNARYEEPKCDTCKNTVNNCNCDEKPRYEDCRNTVDDYKCDEEPRCDTCRNAVDECQCDKKPECITCKNATLGDRVWNDSNANGIQDPNEPGIAGITVNLWTNVNNTPGNIIKTTTTNANGNYLFTNIVPDAYWLQFVVPDALGEWIFSPQNQGTDDTKDSDANASGIAGPICLICGECNPNWDAGLYQYAKLGDHVWNDLNANGIQDPNEPGIAGVIVNLWTSANNAPVSIVKTTTTDANGNYLFTNIVPGLYQLQFVVPQALGEWTFTLQNQGTDDAIDSDPAANGITGVIELVSGEVDLTWDAGLIAGSAAGGEEETPEEEEGAAGGVEENEATGGVEELIPEEVAAAGEEEALEENIAAAGEPEAVSAAEVPMQETGVPVNYLILAVLMVLGGLFGVKRK